MLARLAQGGRQLLVLGDGLGELALRLEQPLLERPDPLRRVLETAAQDHDLFLEAFEHLLELVDLSFVFAQPSLVLGGHERHLLGPCGDPSPGFKHSCVHPIRSSRMSLVPAARLRVLDFSLNDVINC